MTEEHFRQLKTLILDLTVRIDRLEMHLKRQDDVLERTCLAVHDIRNGHSFEEIDTPFDVQELLKTPQSPEQHSDNE